MEKVMFEVLLPFALAKHFAKWTFENGIAVLLSYNKNEFFAGEKICAFVAVPKDIETNFTNEFKNHIVK